MAGDGRPRESIVRVAVIGAGTMGAQISALAARAGFSVSLFDADTGALERAKSRIDDAILPAMKATLPPARASVPRAISFAASLEGAVSGADLVIEAVREDQDVKRGLFAELSRLAPNAILATNSSSIPSSALADSVDNPGRLLNMHFFAPVWVRTILEVMSCGFSDEKVVEAARGFGEALGLTTAVVRKESKGFIMNRIWRAAKRESLRVVDEGIATPEEVDSMFRIFFETRHAPFTMMDMIGLDVIRDVEWSYQRDTLDPTDKPSPILRRLIAEGKLGEKTGEGFYTH
ncbi:MAG: 3-hydroxyacyl-CoA dehydrogenase family protein [Spirochaetota bacterium]